ncbi:MAG TPA: hypothetical protein VFQ45_06575 [Longimicrobium sp.]|nr:hypothetical protein [Longimicrobium sp.]
MPPKVREQLLLECRAMISHLLATGGRVTPNLVLAVEAYQSEQDAGRTPELGPLAAAHERLAKLVAPSTPASILLLDQPEGSGRWAFLGPVKLVRQMMATALICVAAFIALSLFQFVNSDPKNSILDSHGLRLLVNELFWLSASGMGASFAMLFSLNTFIVRRTYDPKYAPSYWIKFLLGIIAGFILVALIPMEGVEGTQKTLAQPTIAMLGGFSATAVYAILTRLVETLESLVRGGNPKDEAQRREELAAARAADEAAQSRLGVAGRLVQLQQQFAQGTDPQDIRRNLGEIIASLVPASAEVEVAFGPEDQKRMADQARAAAEDVAAAAEDVAAAAEEAVLEAAAPVLAAAEDVADAVADDAASALAVADAAIAVAEAVAPELPLGGEAGAPDKVPALAISPPARRPRTRAKPAPVAAPIAADEGEAAG